GVSARWPERPVRQTGGAGLPRAGSAGLGGTGELLAELLDAAGLVHALLGAGVERVRFGTHVELEQRVFLAVDRDLLAGVHGRTRDEAEVAGHVLEHDVAILGVDAFFHREYLGWAGLRPNRADWRKVSG